MLSEFKNNLVNQEAGDHTYKNLLGNLIESSRVNQEKKNAAGIEKLETETGILEIRLVTRIESETEKEKRRGAKVGIVTDIEDRLLLQRTDTAASNMSVQESQGITNRERSSSLLSHLTSLIHTQRENPYHLQVLIRTKVLRIRLKMMNLLRLLFNKPESREERSESENCGLETCLRQYLRRRSIPISSATVILTRLRYYPINNIIIMPLSDSN